MIGCGDFSALVLYSAGPRQLEGSEGKQTSVEKYRFISTQVLGRATAKNIHLKINNKQKQPSLKVPMAHKFWKFKRRIEMTQSYNRKKLCYSFSYISYVNLQLDARSNGDLWDRSLKQNSIPRSAIGTFI